MKKTILSLFLLLAINANTRAQYFQHLYGTPGNDITSGGHKTSLDGTTGHLLTARGADSSYVFTATRTNFRGESNFGGMFNKKYRLRDVPGSSNSLKIQEVHSVEAQNSHYVIAGSYINGSMPTTGNKGAFFQKVDGIGNLIGSPISYTVNNTYSDVHVQKVINSIVYPGDLYILGYLTSNTGTQKHPFLLRVDNNGGLIWSKVYMLMAGNSLEIPYDIIESPVANPSGVQEIMIVGEQRTSPTTDANGFLLRVEGILGNMLNPIQFYGTGSSSDVLTSIKPSSNPNVSPASPTARGYVMGGYTNSTNGSNDFWFVAIDQNGSATWAKTFDYSNAGSAGTDDRCNDIIEHFDNITGQYEYFLGGYTSKGYFGNEDAVIIKTDQVGNTAPSWQYTYGSANNQRCLRLASEDVNGPGISLYGYATWSPAVPSLGNIDEYLVKARFDGSTSCSYNRQTAAQFNGPGLLGTWNNDNTSGLFTERSIVSEPLTDMAESRICYTCTEVAPTPVAHWNFTNGSLVDDINGLTGTIFGGVSSVSGKLGTPNTAYSFNGTNGYIRVPSNPVLDLNSWTITALVKPNGFWNGTCQDNAIVWRAPEYSDTHYDLRIFDNAWDHDCYTYSPSKEVAAGAAAGMVAGVNWLGATPCVSNPCITIGSWYCLWLSYDAANGVMDLYVNGTHKISIPLRNLYGLATVEDLFIGRGDDFITHHYLFNGVIDDVAIYNGPITCLMSCSNQESGLPKFTTSISDEKSPTDVIITPNPTTGKVTITTPATWNNTSLNLYNSIGQLVMSKQINAEHNTTIDISEMPTGVYIIKAINGNEQVVKRIVKE